jgi:amino acid permease
MLTLSVLRNLRITFILQFFFLVYSLVIISIFYNQLKKDTKTISDSEVDGTGITAFVVLGLAVLFSFYQVYHSYYSMKVVI